MACESTSASECPPRPRSESRVTPPSTSGRPETSGCRSIPKPTRFIEPRSSKAAARRPRATEIPGRRDLDVCLEPADDRDRLAEALDECRVVGPGDTVASGLFMRFTEHVDAKRLRRLDGPQVRAIDSRLHAAVTHALDR